MNRKLDKVLYDRSVKLVSQTIENLSDEALTELYSVGGESDIDNYIQNMVLETYDVLSGIGREDEGKMVLHHADSEIREQLRREDINYFIDTVFGDEVDMNWHHLQWGIIANNYDYIAILASRDHGKSYFWSALYVCWMLYKFDRTPQQLKDNKHKGFLFSHTEAKAIDYLEIVKEMIMGNPILKERLYDESNERRFTKAELKTKNGASVKAKGFMSSARGYHPAWIVCDDVLNDSSIYSPTSREKSIDYFKSVVINMLVPNGQLVVVGTPFHEKDLYSIFREAQNLKTWKYMEYPAIRPDGRVLWEGRYDKKRLTERRDILGSGVFSREFLCRPVTSDSSIFPYSILGNSIRNMENYKLINNIEASPIKFENVVIGCDFAISANVGADYTVYSTWGIDENECMWLLNCFRKRGASFNEQIAMIKTLNNNFRPNVVILEVNTFQTLYAQFLENTSIPIKPHTTGKNKHDIKSGLASMAILFERNKIKLPYGDEHSRNIADIFLSEFNSVAYTDKGLQSVSGHDDCPMSTWMARVGAMQVDNGGFGYDFL